MTKGLRMCNQKRKIRPIGFSLLLTVMLVQIISHMNAQISIETTTDLIRFSDWQDTYVFNCKNDSKDTMLVDITILLSDSLGDVIVMKLFQGVALAPNHTKSGQELFKDYFDEIHTSNLDVRDVTQCCMYITRNKSSIEIISKCLPAEYMEPVGVRLASAIEHNLSSSSGQIYVAQVLDLDANNLFNSLRQNSLNVYAGCSIAGLPLNVGVYNGYSSTYFGFTPEYFAEVDTSRLKETMKTVALAKMDEQLKTYGYTINSLESELYRLDNYQSLLDNAPALLDSAIDVAAMEAKAKAQMLLSDSLKSLKQSTIDYVNSGYDSLNQCYIDSSEIAQQLAEIDNKIEKTNVAYKTVSDTIVQLKTLLTAKTMADSIQQRVEKIPHFDELLNQYALLENADSISLRDMQQLMPDSSQYSSLYKIVKNVNRINAGNVFLQEEPIYADGISLRGGFLDYNITSTDGIFGFGGVIKDDFSYFNVDNSFNTIDRVLGLGWRRAAYSGTYTLSILHGVHIDTTNAYQEQWRTNDVLFNNYKTDQIADNLSLNASLGISFTTKDQVEYLQTGAGANWGTIGGIEGSYVNNIYGGLAGALELGYNVDALNLQLHTNYTYINNTYLTCANPFLQSGFQSWSAGGTFEVDTFDLKVNVNGIYKKFFPIADNEFVTSIWQLQLAASASPTKGMTTQLNIYPNVFIVENLQTQVNVTSATWAYSYQLFEHNVVSMINFNATKTVESIEQASAIRQTALVSQTDFQLLKSLQSGIIGNFYRVKDPVTVTTAGIGQSLHWQATDKIELSGNYLVPLYSTLHTGVTGNARISYRLKSVTVGAEYLRQLFDITNAGIYTPEVVSWANVFLGIKI